VARTLEASRQVATSGSPQALISYTPADQGHAAGGSSHRSRLRYDHMPRSASGWLLTIAVPACLVAIAILLAGGGGDEPDAKAQAAAICVATRGELEQQPQSPKSVAAALELEHDGLAIYRREISRLQELAIEDNSFQAGLADDRSLMAGLATIESRPDFVKLSLTLPGHPDLAPSWLKKWLARERSLLGDAHAQFSQAGIPACEQSLG
jgi:hypothetical protein